MGESKSLESEATSFLLLVAGLFFSAEGTLHYIDFFVTSHAVNAVSAVLITGSFAIALLYFGLSYSCWRSPQSVGSFAFSMVLSSALSACFFILIILEALGSKFYFSAWLSYFQLLSGYGSVTVFVELLVAFFSYRVLCCLETRSP